IDQAPQDTTVEVGHPATLNVLASGILPIWYQWEHNGVFIPGATDSSFSVPAASTNDAGIYTVIVTISDSNGTAGTITSPLAHLFVTPAPLRLEVVPAPAGNSITIRFYADAGETHRLLSSTNLMTWLSIATNTTAAAGAVQFIQPIISAPRSF